MNKKQSLFHIAKRDTLPWYKSFAIRGCAILLALVVCAVVTMLLTGENPEWLMSFTLALAGISVLQLIVAWIQAVYSLRINGKLAMVGNTTFLWKVLHMPMAFFSQRMAGDIQGRQSANAMIAEQLVGTLAPLALNAAMMIFYLVVMLRYSVLLTLIGLVSILANLVLSSVISKKRINLTRVQMRDAGKLAGTTVAGIEMIETIKASGADIALVCLGAPKQELF